MQEVLKLLKGARELIAKPEHWTQEVSARNAEGERVAVIANDATCFCAMGAIDRVAGLGINDPLDTVFEARRQLNGTLEVYMPYLKVELDSVIKFNDHSTHPEVIKMFDDTITRLEGTPCQTN